MEEQEIIDTYLLQLMGNGWLPTGGDMTYHFLPFSINKNDPTEKSVFIHNFKEGNYFTTSYILTVKNEKCYLMFNSNEYLILKINNSVVPHHMELQDAKGNIIIYSSKPLIHF